MKNAKETNRILDDNRQVRLNFANQIKRNYQDLVLMTDLELDLLRGLYLSGILNDNIEMIDDLFEACDIEGGPDGRITFEEIRRAVDNMEVFAKTPKHGQPPLAEGEVTLDDLEKVLEKVDIV